MKSSKDYTPMPPRELSADAGNKRLKPAPGPYHHYLRVQTRFTDFDMLGHMNNNVYLSLMDMAKADYFERVMEGGINSHDPGVVVVNINCDYFSPVTPDEPVEVYTTTTRVGERSLTLDQRIVNADTLAVKCVATTVMAGFDMEKMTSRPIDRQWTDALERYEQRKF